MKTLDVGPIPPINFEEYLKSMGVDPEEFKATPHMSSVEGMRLMIEETIPFPVQIGLDELTESLVPVGGWFVRLRETLRNRPTHDLRKIPGVYRFTVLHSEPISEDTIAELHARVEQYRPAGVRVLLSFVRGLS